MGGAVVVEGVEGAEGTARTPAAATGVSGVADRAETDAAGALPVCCVAGWCVAGGPNRPVIGGGGRYDSAARFLREFGRERRVLRRLPPLAFSSRACRVASSSALPSAAATTSGGNPSSAPMTGAMTLPSASLRCAPTREDAAAAAAARSSAARWSASRFSRLSIRRTSRTFDIICAASAMSPSTRAKVSPSSSHAATRLSTAESTARFACDCHRSSYCSASVSDSTSSARRRGSTSSASPARGERRPSSIGRRPADAGERPGGAVGGLVRLG